METARYVTSNVASQVDNAASNVAEKGSEANAGFAGASRRFQFKREPWNATPSGISLSISNFTASFATASAVTSSDSGSSAWQGTPRTCDNTLPRPPSRPSRDVNLFCYRKGIVDFNAKVSDGTFDHCVAEQKLHGVSRQAELDRLMVVLDFQADLNCLQQQAWQRRGQERRLLGGT